MGSTTAFQCDGPKCAELTTKAKGTRAPDSWLRVTIQLPGGDTKSSGAFHDIACVHAWLDQQAAA